jgi:hypothetical protein
MNTPENKGKFFAQYWGQEVIRSLGGHKHHVCEHVNLKHDSWWLELTPLSAITDEDAIEVAKVFSQADFTSFTIQENIIFAKRLIESRGNNLEAKFADYLRSRGYALPWMGISVEDQIKYNWVRIKR